MLRSLVLITTTATFATADEPINFVRDVQPILASKCWSCHGPDANSRQADLRLDLRDAAEHVLNEELIERIASSDADTRMPPPEAKKPLTANEIETLKRWIASGAKYESHWAFVPPVKPRLPHVRDPGMVRNPIDRFILARLESADMPPSPEASKETLIRRLSLDVTGLPPTIEEVLSLIHI